MRRRARLALALLLALEGCEGEGLPEIELKLSKNCNELEVVSIARRVGDGPGEQVIDVAADSGTGDAAWVLLRRTGTTGDEVLVVQQVGPSGVMREIPIELAPSSPFALSLRPDPDSDRVWVVHDEPGLFELLRIAPDDPVRPVLGSDNLVSFPHDDELCSPCDTTSWPRELFFLPNGPAMVSLPPFSIDAVLVVWVATLSTDTGLIRVSPGHRLNFEPPCEEIPDVPGFCEMERMSLSYPEVSVLGVQQDPRQEQTSIFGQRVRRTTYDGSDFPLTSADVFMVSLFLDGSGVPAGILRSYSQGYYGEEYSPDPSDDPPYGVAIDRFAAYGLFSNGGEVARLVQLPNSDPDFTELTSRVSLTLDTQLLQMDRDLALGRLDEGRWELTKLFPDAPAQSRTRVYETDAPITEVVSGGIGTFMLSKTAAPPELVRVRCVEPSSAEVGGTTDVTSTSGTADEG